MGNTCSQCVKEDTTHAEAVRDNKPTVLKAEPGSPTTAHAQLEANTAIIERNKAPTGMVPAQAQPGPQKDSRDPKANDATAKLRDPNALNPTATILKLIQEFGLPEWGEEDYPGKENPIQMKNVEKGLYFGQVSPTTGKLHGRGQLLVKQSPTCLHVGYFLDDHKHGPGRTYLDSYQYIEADWEVDALHGNCYYKNPGEGQWSRHQYAHNKKHGMGEEHWPDGTYFKGEYRSGQKHGQGEMHWPDGNKYAGEFSAGQIQGKGTYTWSDGKTYTGDWVNNKMHGKGEFKWPDGRHYIGDYKDDLKDGYGIFHWSSDKRYEGNWSKGKQHGKGVYINDKGERKEKIFNNGNY